MDKNFRTVLITMSIVITNFLGMFIFGGTFIVWAILSGGLLLLGWSLYRIYLVIRMRWEEFKQVQANEADRIVGRLRGR